MSAIDSSFALTSTVDQLALPDCWLSSRSALDEEGRTEPSMNGKMTTVKRIASKQTIFEPKLLTRLLDMQTIVLQISEYTEQ